MSEALYQAPLLQYLGITRPLILEPYDTTPQQNETKLKTALWTGHFPSIAWWGCNPKCLGIDSNYRPLFSLYKGKKWVLYPHALQLPEGIKGNIFKILDSIDPAGPVPDTDYLVAMIDPERYSCKVYPEPETTHDIFRYDRLAKVGKPGSDEIKYCYLLSGDYKGINQVSIQSNPPQTVIEVNIPAHRVSSLIQLSKEPRYEITRTSSPVLARGDREKFEVKVQNIGAERKYYVLRLITPFPSFEDTSVGFYLDPESSRIVRKDFMVPDTWHLGEDTMIVIDSNIAGAVVEVDTVVFTAWVVDAVQFQLPEKLFVHFAGDTFPFILVNNTERTLTVQLSGNFIEGGGEVNFDSVQPTLDPLASKEMNIKIVSHTDTGKVQILAQTVGEEEPVSVIRPVERAMEPDPAHDLFDDDFSSNTMDDWDTTLGTWQVENGVAKGSSPRHLAFKYDVNEPERWTDYKFQVNTKLDSSDYPLVDWIKSYIYFRVRDTLNYYRFGLAQGFKAISLSKLVNDTLTILTNCDFNVKKNVWYNLRAEVIGNGIKCYLDGNLVISTEDTTFSSGGISIGVTEDGYVNYYDDAVVRKLSR